MVEQCFFQDFKLGGTEKKPSFILNMPRGVVDQESTGGKESRSDPDSMANSEIEDTKESLSDRDSKKKKGVLKSSKKSRR